MQQAQEARRGISVGDCTRHYLATVKRQGRQHSINTATRMVDAITGHFGERMLARSLTQSAVQQFIDSANTAGEGAKRRRYLAAALRSRLRALPCEFPKAPTDHDAPTREALNAHQVALLLKSARDMDVHALLQALTERL